jgi:hypothetical protein
MILKHSCASLRIPFVTQQSTTYYRNYTVYNTSIYTMHFLNHTHFLRILSYEVYTSVIAVLNCVLHMTIECHTFQFILHIFPPLNDLYQRQVFYRYDYLHSVHPVACVRHHNKVIYNQLVFYN